MSSLGFIAALTTEADCLRPLTSCSGCSIRVCGPGAVAARSAALQLADAGVNGLISWGLAGGLDPALKPGQIVLANEIRTIDGQGRIAPLGDLAGLHQTLIGRLAGQSGSLVQVDAPLVQSSEKYALSQSSGAIAADMESAAICEVAIEQGLSFLAIRVIIDPVDQTLPDIALSGLEGTHLATGRVLRELLASPAQLPGSLLLAARFMRARASLRRVARLIAPMVQP